MSVAVLGFGPTLAGTRRARAAQAGDEEVAMTLANPAPDYFQPEDGMFLATLLIVRDIDRSREYYERVFGATCVHDENPLIMRFFNSYIIINVEGGPTDDKPTVQAKAPDDSNTLSCAMNIRVRDIRTLYTEWKARGADFLTEPKDHGTEIRCYLRDPDGYLVEVGQGL